MVLHLHIYMCTMQLLIETIADLKSRVASLEEGMKKYLMPRLHHMWNQQLPCHHHM